MTLHIHTDRTLIRAAARSTRYILARITAPRAPAREQRLPVNVGIVLDRSGSMQGERKFRLAREAVERSLRLLRPDDRFSLVVYDTEVDVLARNRQASPDMVRRALAALDDVGPRGGTNLGAGWLRGCEQVAEFTEEGSVSRCLLLTDGLANAGITDRDELARHAGELRQRGVSTSTFGVGADFDERLLRDMSHEGGGNFYFIEGASQIPEIVSGELGEALEVTVRNATLVLTLPPGVSAEPLNQFRHDVIPSERQPVVPSEARDLQLRVHLGDLISAQQLDVVLAVAFPQGDVGSEVTTRAALMAGNVEVESAREARMTWTYATHHDNDVQPRNREVDRAVAGLYAARARAEATEANRAGRYDRARQVMEATARRIRRYAGDDRELNRTADGLMDESPSYHAPMSVMELKAAFYGASAPLKGRERSGRARRGE